MGVTPVYTDEEYIVQCKSRKVNKTISSSPLSVGCRSRLAEPPSGRLPRLRRRRLRLRRWGRASSSKGEKSKKKKFAPFFFLCKHWLFNQSRTVHLVISAQCCVMANMRDKHWSSHLVHSRWGQPGRPTLQQRPSRWVPGHCGDAGNACDGLPPCLP